MNTLPRPRPLVIVILDGWGVSKLKNGNAVAAADTPNMDRFARHYPTASLAAAGLEVGLPAGIPGNSEVGHRNIGAGRIEYQILASIDRAIENKSFFDNDALINAIAHAKKNNSALHLMGLISSGGVHAQMNHLNAILKMLVKEKFRDRVFIHVFTDGRDAPPRSALTFLRQLENSIGSHGVGTIASVTGRFYAMDRNKNWDRTKAVYDMLSGGDRPPGASSAEQAITRSYSNEISDEKIPPTAITRGGAPVAYVKDNDAVIFFNFRPDRALQLAQAFVAPEKTDLKVVRFKNVFFSTLTEYDPTLMTHAAFTGDVAEFPLARVISDEGLSQLHIAETEKYAHITYYLNVGREEPFDNEERLLVTSSRVRDFSKEPEMKAQEITNKALAAQANDHHDIYFLNYANADMVGHTGDFEATKKACSFLDTALGQLQEAVFARNGALLITADHGKAEAMLDEDSHEEKTSHTTNPVPIHYVRKEMERTTARSDKELDEIWSSPAGILADVAPTILDIMQIEKPVSMTGISVLGSLR